MHIRALALFVFASLTAVARGSAQAQGLQLPAPVGYVNDFAHVIPADKAAAISAIIDDVKAKSGGEIVVVTLPDLKGRPVEEVGLQIGRQWGVGTKGNPGDPARNTGVILLVVPKETSADGSGHIRTEIGFGAEGFLTDGTTGEFRDLAIPYFRNRDYGSGILLMVDSIAAHFANEYKFQVNPNVQPQIEVERPAPRGRSGGGIPPVVWFVLLFIVLSLISGRRGRGCGGGGCLPIFLPIRRRWMGREEAVVGAAVDSVAAGAVAVDLVVSEVEAVLAVVAPADLGDPWRE